MTENATVTVTYGGKSVTVELSGTELSESSLGNGYLNNASRGFVADEVERALLSLTDDTDGKRLASREEAAEFAATFLPPDDERLARCAVCHEPVTTDDMGQVVDVTGSLFGDDSHLHSVSED
jgi:hypothetical protein